MCSYITPCLSRLLKASQRCYLRSTKAPPYRMALLRSSCGRKIGLPNAATLTRGALKFLFSKINSVYCSNCIEVSTLPGFRSTCTVRLQGAFSLQQRALSQSIKLKNNKNKKVELTKVPLSPLRKVVAT